MIVSAIESAVRQGPDLAVKDQKIRELAQEFEAVFLAQMLKHSGLNRGDGSFGGGAGEAAFSSLLTEQYANQMAKTGGIGIADHVYRTLGGKGVL